MNLPGLRLEGDLSGLEWRSTKHPGVAWLPLHLDEPGGIAGGRRPGATVLIRMEPGRGYAPHRHLGTEDVLVLAGGYRDALGEYRQGDHVHYPAGSEHAPIALGDSARPVGSANPVCVLYASAPGGIELLEPYTRDDS